MTFYFFYQSTLERQMKDRSSSVAFFCSKVRELTVHYMICTVRNVLDAILNVTSNKWKLNIEILLRLVCPKNMFPSSSTFMSSLPVDAFSAHKSKNSAKSVSEMDEISAVLPLRWDDAWNYAAVQLVSFQTYQIGQHFLAFSFMFLFFFHYLFLAQ